MTAGLPRSADKATAEDVHRYQLWLASIGTTVATVNVSATALRFFFKVTLKRHDLAESKAQVVLEDTAQQDVLPFAIFWPAEEAYFDLMQLAGGFGSLGRGLFQLAYTVENRKLEYASTLDTTENELKRVAQGIEDIH